MDVLRRTFAAVRINLHYGVNLVYALVGLVLGTAAIVLGSTTWSLVALVPLAVGVVRLVWGWRKAMAPGLKLSQDSRDPGELPDRYESPYDTWKVISAGHAVAVHSPELDARLAADAYIAVQKDRGMWWPDFEPAREYARLWPTRPNVLNEKKIRLCSDLSADSQAVSLRRTDYASYLMTNNLAKREVYRDGVRMLELEAAITRKNGAVRRFSASHAANHLGGDVLAISPGSAFLQVQGSTEVNPHRRLASGSGSFDYRDTWFTHDLVSLVKKSLLRELREEMGLGRWARSTPRPADVRLIGFARATYMGGKPQFFAVARVPAGTTPKRRRAERQWLERVGYAVDFDTELGLADLVEQLRILRDKAANNFAESLIILIELLDQWRLRDPEADNWILGRDPS